ncbi:MAG: hypothetical protein LBV72_13395 [Tannerella sp.]|nr:hypothetical protein [Tannerella sp.]
MKLDEDYFKPYLCIISDDRKLQLVYRLNQINDKFIHPKIRVAESEKLKTGWYHFFPPIADESMSAHNVSAILNWHEKQHENMKPIEEKNAGQSSGKY